MNRITVYTIFAFFSLCSSNNMDAKQKDVIWGTTIGVLYEINSSTKQTFIKYKVDSIIYCEDADIYSPDDIEGERYVVYYDIAKPKIFKIDFTRPLFEKGESTGFLTAKVVEIKDKSFWNSTPILVYKYKFSDGEVKYKWQHLPLNYRQLYPNLQEGQLYNVEVWMENPYRAVFRFDLPIKKLKRR